MYSKRVYLTKVIPIIVTQAGETKTVYSPYLANLPRQAISPTDPFHWDVIFDRPTAEDIKNKTYKPTDMVFYLDDAGNEQLMSVSDPLFESIKSKIKKYVRPIPSRCFVSVFAEESYHAQLEADPEITRVDNVTEADLATANLILAKAKVKTTVKTGDSKMTVLTSLMKEINDDLDSTALEKLKLPRDYAVELAKKEGKYNG